MAKGKTAALSMKVQRAAVCLGPTSWSTLSTPSPGNQILKAGKAELYRLWKNPSFAVRSGRKGCLARSALVKRDFEFLGQIGHHVVCVFSRKQMSAELFFFEFPAQLR